MSLNRIVTLIDMDCFYCQVEVRADSALRGKPVAVVQYNSWKGGGIIAVNYEARAGGITRGMRGDEALKKCPDIKLVSVPEIRGKADLTKYRNAGREVIAVLCEFSANVEKASIDEAYVDLTDAICRSNDTLSVKNLKNTYVVGYNTDQKGTKQWLNDIYHNGINDDSLHDLARGAALVEEIRAAILNKTEFHCSAGISHNKILAKLACGINKPNRQTVLPITSVSMLFSTLPLKKIRSLGGKLGDTVQEQLGVTNMGEITQFSLNDLQCRFGEKNGLWLYNMARGINSEPVKPRLVSKSIGCCKNFKGPAALTTKDDVKHWLKELAAEIVDRIEDDFVMNNRRPTALVVNIHQDFSENVKPISKTLSCNTCNQNEIVQSAFTALSKYNKAPLNSPSWSPALQFLGLSTGKFIEVQKNEGSLLKFFKQIQKTEISGNESAIKNGDDLKLEEVDSSEQIVLVTENKNINFDKDVNESANNSKPFTSDLSSFVKQNENSDFRKSFFCKYFAGKRLQEHTNNDINNKLIVHDVPSTRHNNELNSKVELIEHKPSTSKCSNDEIVFDDSPKRLSMLDDMKSTKEIISHETCEGTSGFFITDEELSNDACNATEICTECNQPVRLVEFLEHLDYHMASKLQKEFDAANTRTNDNRYQAPAIIDGNNKNTGTLKPVKKAAGEKRKLGKHKSLNCPPKRNLAITNFFQVKPQIGSFTDK